MSDVEGSYRVGCRRRGSIALVAVALAVIAAGCSSSLSPYDRSLYDLLKDATPESVKVHRKILESMIEDAEEENRKPRPGAYAELGWMTAAGGDDKRGLELLKKEVTVYPESAKFVSVIGRMIEGEQLDTKANGKDGSTRSVRPTAERTGGSR